MEPIVKFEDIKSFNDFVVQYDGKTLKLSKKLAMSYYVLCQSHGKFLHEGLIKSVVTDDLARAMIQEAVNIGECMSGAQISTAPHHMNQWKKTVDFLGGFGMSVEFFRDRLNQFDEILREYEVLTESEKTNDAQIEEEMNLLREKNAEYLKTMERMHAQMKLVQKRQAEVDSLESRCENLSFLFQKVVANLPW